MNVKSIVFLEEYIFVILFIWNQEHIELFWGNLNWNVSVYDWEIEGQGTRDNFLRWYVSNLIWEC